MFDIGFLELVIVGIIALLVLGPERLPVAARHAGRWLGKARRMASQFSREIDRQIDAEELRETLKKQGESLNIEEDVRNIQQTVQSALNDVKDFEPHPREDENKPFIDHTANDANDANDINSIGSHSDLDQPEPPSPKVSQKPE